MAVNNLVRLVWNFFWIYIGKDAWLVCYTGHHAFLLHGQNVYSMGLSMLCFHAQIKKNDLFSNICVEFQFQWIKYSGQMQCSQAALLSFLMSLYLVPPQVWDQWGNNHMQWDTQMHTCWPVFTHHKAGIYTTAPYVQTSVAEMQHKGNCPHQKKKTPLVGWNYNAAKIHVIVTVDLDRNT